MGVSPPPPPKVALFLLMTIAEYEGTAFVCSWGRAGRPDGLFTCWEWQPHPDLVACPHLGDILDFRTREGRVHLSPEGFGHILFMHALCEDFNYEGTTLDFF